MSACWGAGECDRGWTGWRLVVALVCAGLLAVGIGVTDASAAERPPTRPTPSAATASFGLELLQALPPGNAAISPDSVLTALAMAGSGAKGATAKQIAGVLHLSGPAAFDT